MDRDLYKLVVTPLVSSLSTSMIGFQCVVLSSSYCALGSGETV